MQVEIRNGSLEPEECPECRVSIPPGDSHTHDVEVLMTAPSWVVPFTILDSKEGGGNRE